MMAVGTPQVCPGCDPHLRHAGRCFGNLRTSTVVCRCTERYRHDADADRRMDHRERPAVEAGSGPGDGLRGDHPGADHEATLSPAYGTMASLSLHMEELAACGRELGRSCGWSDEALDRLWADVKAAGP